MQSYAGYDGNDEETYLDSRFYNYIDQDNNRGTRVVLAREIIKSWYYTITLHPFHIRVEKMA